jgi:hypothetical protein
MYGAWDALKNVDKLFPNHRLGWAAFIAGKRESRRLLGDVVLTADDFRTGREYPDGCFPCSWHIDIHTPHPDFDKGHAGNEFISRATTGTGYAYKSPYWAPYRTLYSRNITNLFMAGRDISVTREGLGPVRVMKTCGMMGEIVGKAAWICVRHETSPRGVYEKHLPLLKELMSQPGAMRRDAPGGPLALPPSANAPANSGGDFDFNAMIQPVPATAMFSDPDFNIWCGSAVKGDDGTFHLIYKAVGLRRALPFGGPGVHLVATADIPTGPFAKRPGEVFGAKGVMFVAEDPFIWRGYSLALWESADGLGWNLARHPLVATPEVTWADGRTQRLNAQERPQVLFDNGAPIALLCAAADNKGRDGSFNLQIPIKKP